MLLDFVVASKSDSYPTLRKGQFQKLTGKTIKGGENVLVTLRTNGGPNGPTEVVYPAKVAKAGDKLYFAGWNNFLFDQPVMGDSVQHEVISIAKLGSVKTKTKAKTVKTVKARLSASSKSRITAYPSKTRLKRVLSQAGGVKTLAAEILGTNPRTFGRMLASVGL